MSNSALELAVHLHAIIETQTETIRTQGETIATLNGMVAELRDALGAERLKAADLRSAMVVVRQSVAQIKDYVTVGDIVHDKLTSLSGYVGVQLQ